MSDPNLDQIAARNQRTGALIFVLVVGMVGLSFLSVPLYRLFCQATGWGGAAQILTVSPPSSAIRDRLIEIRFNADVDQGLPWSFRPADRSLTFQVGQEGLTSFIAHNQSAQPITGTAIYNVLPEKAGKYFHKTQCFCFGEQHLTPGQEVHMPVMFYVDPDFVDDPNMEDVQTITLSYTFYRTESPELETAIKRYQSP